MNRSLRSSRQTSSGPLAILKILGGTLLGGLFLWGAFSVIRPLFDRDPTTPIAATTTTSSVPDTAPTLPAPLERLRSGQARPEDLFLVLPDDEAINAFVPETFGPLTLTGEEEFVSYGYWETALDGNPIVYGWTQARTNATGTFASENLLLDSPAGAETVWNAWKQRAVGDGLLEQAVGLDPAMFSVSFADDSTGAARCGTQTLTRVGPMVILVTLITDGACTADLVPFVSQYAYSLRTFANLTVGWE